MWRPIEQSNDQNTPSTGDSTATTDEQSSPCSSRDVDRRHDGDDRQSSPERQGEPWNTDYSSDDKLTSTARWRCTDPELQLTALSTDHTTAAAGRRTWVTWRWQLVEQSQHDIALLHSRLSVSDTVQLTRPERESISTATDYENDGNAPSNTGYQFAMTLRNILLATSAVHTITRPTQLVTVSVSDCELNVSTSDIRRKARARCTRRQAELSVCSIRVIVNKQQTDWRVGRQSVGWCWSRKWLVSHAVDRDNSKRSYRTTEN